MLRTVLEVLHFRWVFSGRIWKDSVVPCRNISTKLVDTACVMPRKWNHSPRRACEISREMGLEEALGKYAFKESEGKVELCNERGRKEHSSGRRSQASDR